ncbi:M15 family metallopeptidase [Deinococcus navajonensis]|uniref:M15 family metallopeptidase n=1 Tax=Deinococcus navajonensis TaxID=309884 RepID=A0ABV8XJQ3_9DEIO
MIWVLLLASGVRALGPTDQAKVQRLVQAYPAFLKGVEDDQLVWRDGTRMPLTRAKAASYTALLNQPGLLDQLDATYPSCAPVRPPSRNEDPGRVRFEPLFKKMYGASPSQVMSSLVSVNWFGQALKVTSVNGAAQSLERVAQELARQPALLAFVRPSAGTFLWRKVAGTPRLSVHAFGAAIDLNVSRSHYWQWAGYREGQAGITYRNRFPLALVQVFERHGWIWGGRWYHYDTMHFEYRPELTGAAGCR